MTTKRVHANKENAKASTGPRTLAGKAVASMNALQHGALSGAVILPGEDPADLAALEQGLRLDLAPQGAYEGELVRIVTRDLWRLRRIGRAEDGVYARAWAREIAEAARADASQYEVYEDPLRIDFGGKLTITDEQAHDEALGRAGAARRVAEAEGQLAARVHCDSASGEPLGRLARYEGALRREIFRCLHELERRQAARQGQHDPAPVAVDVTVDGKGE
jgi:hypothetical protein